MSDEDDLKREIDTLLRQLEARPPTAVETDAARRARERARDKKIRAFVDEADRLLRDRKA